MRTCLGSGKLSPALWYPRRSFLLAGSLPTHLSLHVVNMHAPLVERETPREQREREREGLGYNSVRLIGQRLITSLWSRSATEWPLWAIHQPRSRRRDSLDVYLMRWTGAFLPPEFFTALFACFSKRYTMECPSEPIFYSFVIYLLRGNVGYENLDWSFQLNNTISSNGTIFTYKIGNTKFRIEHIIWLKTKFQVLSITAVFLQQNGDVFTPMYDGNGWERSFRRSVYGIVTFRANREIPFQITNGQRTSAASTNNNKQQ